MTARRVRRGRPHERRRPPRSLGEPALGIGERAGDTSKDLALVTRSSSPSPDAVGSRRPAGAPARMSSATRSRARSATALVACVALVLQHVLTPAHLATHDHVGADPRGGHGHAHAAHDAPRGPLADGPISSEHGDGHGHEPHPVSDHQTQLAPAGDSRVPAPSAIAVASAEPPGPTRLETPRASAKWSGCRQSRPQPPPSRTDCAPRAPPIAA